MLTVCSDAWMRERIRGGIQRLSFSLRWPFLVLAPPPPPNVKAGDRQAGCNQAANEREEFTPLPHPFAHVKVPIGVLNQQMHAVFVRKFNRPSRVTVNSERLGIT